jgi:excisionase family DNA binding protein
VTKYLSTKSAAAYLDTTPQRIRDLIYRGQLRAYHEGSRILIRVEDLERRIRESS